MSYRVINRNTHNRIHLNTEINSQIMFTAATRKKERDGGEGRKKRGRGEERERRRKDRGRGLFLLTDAREHDPLFDSSREYRS